MLGSPSICCTSAGVGARNVLWGTVAVAEDVWGEGATEVAALLPTDALVGAGEDPAVELSGGDRVELDDGDGVELVGIAEPVFEVADDATVAGADVLLSSPPHAVRDIAAKPSPAIAREVFIWIS